MEEVKSRFITAAEIAADCGVSASTAYKIIRDLNAELKELGKVTLSGKINRRFYEKKMGFEDGPARTA